MTYISLYIHSATTTLFDRVAWSWSSFEEQKPVPRYTHNPQTRFESMYSIPKMFNRFVGLKFKIGGSKK